MALRQSSRREHERFLAAGSSHPRLRPPLLIQSSRSRRRLPDLIGQRHRHRNHRLRAARQRERLRKGELAARGRSPGLLKYCANMASSGTVSVVVCRFAPVPAANWKFACVISRSVT